MDLLDYGRNGPRRPIPALVALTAALPKLTDRDREIAGSLLEQATRRHLSAKQLALAGQLADRAKAPPAPAIDGLGPIVDMLATAAMTLKWPVVRFEADGVRYRLGRAGEGAREPGSISVTSDDRAYADRTYFGRISLIGVFDPSPAQAATATAIGAALRAFAAAPAEQARLYGQRFGRCCFCGLELTNAGSIRAGYGPICAEKYGLPVGG